MIVADSSTWIDHWRMTSLNFTRLLVEEQLVMHPYVLVELALGSVKNRRRTLASLRDLKSVPVATNEQVLHLVETRNLFSKGIGFVDTHLLALCLLDGTTKLLTRDRRLHAAAEGLGVAA